MTKEPRDIGLMGEIGRNFVCLIIFVGLVIGAIVYQVLGGVLREQHNKRASAITTNLSDAAAGYVLSRNVLQLNSLIAKYARLNGVAYALIKDREGKISAHSLAIFPREVQEVVTAGEQPQVNRRVLTLQGKTVYETHEPILEGQLGTAHLGMWADAVEQEVYKALFMLMWPITLVLVVAAIVAVFLARRLVRPFRQLTDVAGRISAGDLDIPVRVESRNEFGELTRSLERMRASLKAAMLRIGQN
jgi:methyl-accepting chemotaxis protein